MIELLFILLLLAPVIWLAIKPRWQQITITDQDKEFLEQREMQFKAIVKAFGVPPSALAREKRRRENDAICAYIVDKLKYKGTPDDTTTDTSPGAPSGL